MGRRLSDYEVAFCNRRGWTHGHDGDDEKEQLSHVCNGIMGGLNGAKALCGSPRLWLVGGEWRHMRGDDVTFVEEDDVVSCDACLLMLDQAIKAARVARGRKAG
jgi:hypothetical protein